MTVVLLTGIMNVVLPLGNMTVTLPTGDMTAALLAGKITAVLLTGNNVGGYAQLIAVLVIFVLILALTAFTTKWIANYQKQQNVNNNIDIIETARLTNNKFIQIIRVGDIYLAIAVCKDTVTLLGELPKEQIKACSEEKQALGFKELLNKALNKDSGDAKKP